MAASVEYLRDHRPHMVKTKVRMGGRKYGRRERGRGGEEDNMGGGEGGEEEVGGKEGKQVVLQKK